MLETWEISPIVAYRFMKKYFGKPNENVYYVDGKCQWTYILKSPHGYLSVYDWKRDSWNIGFRYEKETGGWTQVDEKLKADAKSLFLMIRKYNYQLKKLQVTPSTYSGKLLFNPFDNHYCNALYHIETAKKLQSEMNKLGFELNDSKKRYKLSEQIRSLCQAAFILLMASFEGFLNLLYELYSHKDLRENQIKYLLRMPMENKLRLLPYFCNAFARSLSDRTNTFKKFCYLVTLRNAIVHANLTRETKQDILVEDGYLYYMGAEEDKEHYGIPRNPIYTGIEEIYRVKHVIDSMVREVLKAMSKEEREAIKTVLHEPYIAYIRKNDKVEFRQSQLY